MKISYIIPCYRSEQTLATVVAEIDETMAGMKQYEHEIILVNDGSPDGTEAVIRALCGEKPHLTGLSLARNFGQHAALMAGFRQATGDIVVCLDDDGQTPAKEAGKLIAAIEDGADAVYARYIHKQHAGLRNLGSRLNDYMTRVMLGKPKNLYISSYFAVKAFIAEEIKRYEGAYPYVIGLVLRATENIVNVDVSHHARLSGASGYTMGKLFALWLNGFTAFSIKPLRMATLAGAISAIAGFLYAIYTVIKRLFIQPEGLTVGFSALMCAILVLGGLILIMLGLVGEYIGRMYITMNNSPQYVIKETFPPARP
ncbi:MAG: glycosyltransferase [Lachnospiraceae bacterium]|jgi:undecaprenyl-phosphate 4-deoxy-4-formamido-L-arabinose transferase|nr:glycosyltransferase [Lachnospiraceae bacterium]